MCHPHSGRPKTHEFVQDWTHLTLWKEKNVIFILRKVKKPTSLTSMVKIHHFKTHQNVSALLRKGKNPTSFNTKCKLAFFWKAKNP